ncbi:MAG: SusF/SusE family outer membrane protein [Saprospiraceae bacterium]
MKNILKYIAILLIGTSIFSCTPEEINIKDLTNFPPGILSISPSDGSRVARGDFDIVGKFVSGTVSTLASASIKVTDASGKEIASATKSISGTSDSLVIKGSTFNSTTLPLGFYKMVVSVTDTEGKTQTVNIQFEVYILPAVGIIGSATPKGWGEDTDMTHIGNGVFELVITLTDGEAKFRADDAWTVNWGAADFPSGIGRQDGPNIPISAGTWRVRFEPGTGAYSFTRAVALSSNAKDLYLVGTFNNFQGNQYKFNLVANNTWVLKEIQLKPTDQFRFAEGPFLMGRNWGDTDKDGRADEFGNNIKLGDLPSNKGEAFYTITFNDRTRIYSIEFVKFPSIGIIGSATPGGWDADTDMTDKGDGTFQLLIALKDGEAKFRANDSWDTNWGGGDFPKGIGTQNGPNIPVKAGTYKVTFKPATGEYNFEPGISFVGIIGSATPGGWGADTELKDNGDGSYSAVVGLGTGEAKFRINNSWDTNWGANGFPSGTGTQGGPNIPVTPGIYVVTFTPGTGEYKFEPASIGLIGTAQTGGWSSDTDMVADATTPGEVTLTITLSDGEAKFRTNNDWKFNWGNNTFPSGTATPGGPNIPVKAGNYTIKFNVNTGAYSFQ